MNTGEVWTVVAAARAQVQDPTDTDVVVRRMVEILADRSPKEIVAFEQPLWDLLTASYRADLLAAAHVINRGASDDEFDDFRGWLIAQGREVFDGVLADPDSLADLPAVAAAMRAGRRLGCGATLSLVWDAYLVATGTDLPAHTITARYAALDPAWSFDFDDEREMERRLPRLTGIRLPSA